MHTLSRDQVCLVYRPYKALEIMFICSGTGQERCIFLIDLSACMVWSANDVISTQMDHRRTMLHSPALLDVGTQDENI